ncbi:hypothetical protein BHYA_0034g00090 [Botrytis hyacinthi]|uniref:Uncharacterized protein n=1 Tax=Botrytis hyacinthi TaxID=278943 RepID=A0A4Z1GZT6_9HELO|nr:hypothetical protein BHYA_0034g00090 [Botrytis hyacinthi]
MGKATSNVDKETDALMQCIIRDVFADRTITAVAHRVALFEQIELTKCDSPTDILSSKTFSTQEIV